MGTLQFIPLSLVHLVFRNKAVADGAISFYLDHFVTTRVANLTYGVEIDVECDADDLEHRARYHTSYYDATGLRYVPGAFSSILKKV